ncbi:MAG: hypothetical protein ABSG83_06190 [Roseiarcus sp.]
MADFSRPKAVREIVDFRVISMFELANPSSVGKTNQRQNGWNEIFPALESPCDGPSSKQEQLV